MEGLNLDYHDNVIVSNLYICLCNATESVSLFTSNKRTPHSHLGGLVHANCQVLGVLPRLNGLYDSILQVFGKGCQLRRVVQLCPVS